MNDPIKPALTPKQWKERRVEGDLDESPERLTVSLQVVPRGLLCRCESADDEPGEALEIGFGHRVLNGVVAIANAALPDGDQRKLMHRHATAIAVAAEAGPGDVLDRPALREAAAILAALLPAREG